MKSPSPVMGSSDRTLPSEKLGRLGFGLCLALKWCNLQNGAQVTRCCAYPDPRLKQRRKNFPTEKEMAAWRHLDVCIMVCRQLASCIWHCIAPCICPRSWATNPVDASGALLLQIGIQFCPTGNGQCSCCEPLLCQELWKFISSWCGSAVAGKALASIFLSRLKT